MKLTNPIIVEVEKVTPLERTNSLDIVVVRTHEGTVPLVIVDRRGRKVGDLVTLFPVGTVVDAQDKRFRYLKYESYYGLHTIGERLICGVLSEAAIADSWDDTDAAGKVPLGDPGWLRVNAQLNDKFNKWNRRLWRRVRLLLGWM